MRQVVFLCLVFLVTGWTRPTHAATCHTDLPEKKFLQQDPEAQEKIRQNILNGCPPTYKPKQGGMTGYATSEDTMEFRVKASPSRPSFKYSGQAPVAGCDANTFGKAGGESSGGTTDHCDKSRPSGVPHIQPPDTEKPTNVTKENTLCLARLFATFHEQGHGQVCAMAGVQVCMYNFTASGCVGDRDGAGGWAPPDGFFTYMDVTATVGIGEKYFTGPFYFYHGGSVTLPAPWSYVVGIPQGYFVFFQKSKRTIYIYDKDGNTIFAHQLPEGSPDEYLITSNDGVIFTALCALDDSCYPGF